MLGERGEAALLSTEDFLKYDTQSTGIGECSSHHGKGLKAI